jgi:hypothetical protein
MSVWAHITGSLALDGIIGLSVKDGNIKELLKPLPNGSEGPAECNVIFNEPGNLHFADVLVSGDLRDVDSLDEIESWLDGIITRLVAAGIWFRMGCFMAEIEYGARAVYVLDSDGDTATWVKIPLVRGDES